MSTLGDELRAITNKAIAEKKKKRAEEKAEQERQAKIPESVRERILVIEKQIKNAANDGKMKFVVMTLTASSFARGTDLGHIVANSRLKGKARLIRSHFRKLGLGCVIYPFKKPKDDGLPHLPGRHKYAELVLKW